MNTRITLDDTIQSMLFKMSEGNPGAISVLVNVLGKGDKIDQAAAMGGGLATILDLDMAGIYGPKIWMLYKDQCGEDLEKFMAVMRAWQLGHLTTEQIQASIEVDRYPTLDVDGALAFVKAELGDQWVSPTPEV